VAKPNKTDLTSEEKEAIKSAPSLKELNKILTTEEIMALNIPSLSELGDTEDKPTKKEAKSDADDGWDEFDKF